MKRIRTFSTPTHDGDENTRPLRSIRNVANMMGIGRTRVVQEEQAALSKIRLALEGAGVTNDSDFLDSSSATFDKALRQMRALAGRRQNGSAKAASGWFAVTRICSLNGGSEDPEDVERAFNFLKEMNDRVIRPPAIIRGGKGVSSPFRVQNLLFREGTLSLRCWPINRAKVAITDLTTMRCTLIVESEFGTDAGGDFDVPVVCCAVFSAPLT